MVPVEPGPDAQDQAAPLPQAFLVFDGDRFISLERSVITIGRRRDNTIVVDDARVSRQHCQVRFRFGEFVLYDLGSRGGTFVNQLRVSECVLRPGDVISLAGVQMVYMVEDGTTGRSGGDTQVRLTRHGLEPE
jgi:pSer/pThr/pTyr-binding forkhead associated (FHA) protein